MARKLPFALITLFWVTMNALLWRAEFSGKEIGAATPVPLVWEKILTSPDDSGLAVYIANDRVGYIRWSPNIGEETATGKTANENTEIEGRIKTLTGYTIHTEGNFIVPDGGGRIRFDFDGAFGANHDWKKWTLRGMQRPNIFSISADRATQTFEFALGEGAAALKQKLRFADLQNAGPLLEAAGVSAQLPMLAAVIPSLSSTNGASTNGIAFQLGLRWQAQQDWLAMGHSRVKVYRLRAHLLDKYEAVLIISRVGEILRVDLPGNIALVNEALINL